MGGDIPMTGSHRTQSAHKAPIAEEATPRQGAITLSAHTATTVIGKTYNKHKIVSIQDSKNNTPPIAEEGAKRR